MVSSQEQAFREKVTDMFLTTYLPKLKKEVERLMYESEDKVILAQSVSELVGRSVGIHLGMLLVADPTNELIDSIVKLYVQEKEKQV